MAYNTNKKQFKGFTIWTVILIVVVVIVAGVVVFSFIFSRKETKTPSALELPPSESRATPVPELEGQTGRMTGCIGTILAIKGSEITLKAEKTRNPLDEDKVYTVTVDSHTVIRRFSENFSGETKNEKGETVMIVGRHTQEALDKGVMTLGDLDLGDSLNIVSGRDIRRRDSFIAKYINVY